MFKVIEKTNSNIKTLSLSNNLFHEAYEIGDFTYHVKGKNSDFDIIYIDNDSIVPDTYKKMYMKVGINEVLPKYNKYDENNIGLISYRVFDNKKNIAFEDINEYSIVMAKLLLANGYEVYFNNELINAFIDKNDRLHIVKSFGSLDKNDTCIIKNIDDMFLTSNNDSLNYILAFHNMFFLQDFIDRSLKSVKYIKIRISSVNGIGIIPIYLKKLNNAFSKYNIKIVLDPNGTKYSTNLLNRLFSYDFSPDDMDDTNTINLNNISRIMLTYFYIKSDERYGYEIFSKEFLKECEDFLHNTINGKKTLALLIRGTDYISTNTLGEQRMAPVDVLLPIVDKWMKEDKYEAIFLATEDLDVLDKFKKIYTDRLYYVEQKRFRASEFKNGQTIAEREKEKYSNEEYQKNVDDTTIKYLKALYLLSKCDSFICSGMCNGYQVVKSLNAGRFKKEYLYKGENV